MDSPELESYAVVKEDIQATHSILLAVPVLLILSSAYASIHGRCSSPSHPPAATGALVRRIDGAKGESVQKSRECAPSPERRAAAPSHSWPRARPPCHRSRRSDQVQCLRLCRTAVLDQAIQSATRIREMIEFIVARKIAATGRELLSSARLPAFHTCVGANDQLLTQDWYKEHGIELMLCTKVVSADVHGKTLLTSSGEVITYTTLIVATGARVSKMEEFGGNGSDAENVCYLRSIEDADRLVSVMRSCPGGNAIVIGGGYIGMECAAALVANKIKVTIVFPGKHCMGRLFTPKIAEFYENYYTSKGVTFIKGNAVSSLEISSSGKVTTAILRDGRCLPADMVVVGIGARANTTLFEGQLAMDKGGIKVNGQMQASDASVYAVGDVATLPVKLFGGERRRFEHVDCARRTARHAVAAALDTSGDAGDIDYLPFFYSRVFTLSWRFYGDNAGEAVHFGDLDSAASSGKPKFGAFWVSEGRVAGAFLEGGSPEEYEAIAAAVRRGAAVPDASQLAREGLAFVLQEGKSGAARARPGERGGGGGKSAYAWHATAGVAAAVTIAALAYWYARKAPCLVKRGF